MYGQDFVSFFDWQLQQKLSDSQALDLDPQNHQRHAAFLYIKFISVITVCGWI
jgi:hypothetical protein